MSNNTTTIFAIPAILLLLLLSSFSSLPPSVTTMAQQQQMTTTTGGATTTTSDTTTTTSAATITFSPSSGGIELSSQLVWEELATNTGLTPINQTHSIATFIGNGTLTVPDTGETIPMTNNGTAFISPLTESGETVSAYGKENVFSEDGDTSAITFYEIVRYNPTTLEGKGLTIAVFDANATGSLAPFNGMFIVGTHEEDPSIQGATFTLWEWESGIPLPTMNTTTMEESPPSPMNTTNNSNDTSTAAGIITKR
jgi:hypothetical protein